CVRIGTMQVAKHACDSLRKDNVACCPLLSYGSAKIVGVHCDSRCRRRPHRRALLTRLSCFAKSAPGTFALTPTGIVHVRPNSPCPLHTHPDSPRSAGGS